MRKAWENTHVFYVQYMRHMFNKHMCVYCIEIKQHRFDPMAVAFVVVFVFLSCIYFWNVDMIFHAFILLLQLEKKQNKGSVVLDWVEHMQLTKTGKLSRGHVFNEKRVKA